MAQLCRPTVTRPEVMVSTEELTHYLRSRYRDDPGLARAMEVIERTGVEQHWFSRPLDEWGDPHGSLDIRLDHHHQDTIALAEAAATAALETAGITASEVGCLVCAGTGGYRIPGIDVVLLQRLGMAPTTRRLSITQLGCAGGVFALARAAELLSASEDKYALVICADVFTPYLHPADTAMDAMIFRGLLSDAAASCVVGSGTNGPGPHIMDTWDYTVPDTDGVVRARVAADGLHLHNSPRLYSSLGVALPLVRERIGKPDFIICHTGGPRILDLLADGLRVPPERFALARESLRRLGNAGSVSVLDVAARTFDRPPAAGSDGVIIAVGPGLTITMCTCEWRDGA